MKLLGLDVSRPKWLGGGGTVPHQKASGSELVTTVPTEPEKFWVRWAGAIHEAFPGAWQRNLVLDSTEDLLAFSAIYACVTLISSDIAKLRIKLTQWLQDQQIWSEIQSAAFSPVLRKPNHFQTRIQFLESWIISKLIWGNTYVLKERDQRGVVVALYVLDPKLCRPVVTPRGDIYYQLNGDRLSGIAQTGMLVPASEIIHDRGPCLFHPLCGIPPIYACAMSATQGRKIQTFASKFFNNMARPSGVLTAPDVIDDDVAARLKRDFEANFSGENIGRLLVAGNNLKFEALAVPADQAQLIDQLKWTGEDVARCFHVPAHKLGLGQAPTFNNIAALNQDYYTQCLQSHIESVELLLDEGLGLTLVPGVTYGTELDVDQLLRMDPITATDVADKKVKSSIWSPNEARRKDNLPPTKGGEEPLAQQQIFPLSVLADRPPPPAPGTAPAPAPAAADPSPAKALEFDQRMAEVAQNVERQLGEKVAEVTGASRAAVDSARVEFEGLMKGAVSSVTALIERAEAAAARLEVEAMDPDDVVTDEVKAFALALIADFQDDDELAES